MSLEKKIKKVVKSIVKNSKREGVTTCRVVNAMVNLDREPYERAPGRYKVTINVERVA